MLEVSGTNTRKVRVFISCTFRDMERERSALEKITFPALRSALARNHVELTSVDIGWGMTSYIGDPGDALEMCLANVARSTYFIGLIGDSYGTEFDTPSERLLADYPWLTQRDRRSFTELECVCGVLGPTPTARRAFFYLRTGNLSNANGLGSDGPPIVSTKLEALRSEIRASDSIVREYGEIDTLAEVVFNYLVKAVAVDFGGNS